MSTRLIAIGVLCFAFVALAASNWFAYSRWQSEKEKRVGAETVAAINAQAAQQCSESVGRLEEAAKAQAVEAAASVAAAKDRALKAEKRAQKILSTGPSTPGNDCKSASDRVDSWLTAR